MKWKIKLGNAEQSQWDFSKCPKDQLSLCYAHEYFRQLALVHRAGVVAEYKEWSPKLFATAFDGYYSKGKRVGFKEPKEGAGSPFEANLLIRRTFAKVVSVCTGFPNTPFLDLDNCERDGWIKTLNLEQLRPDRPTMAQKTLFDITLAPNGVLDLYQHTLAWAHQNLKKGDKIINEGARKIVDYDGFKFEMGVLRVNWSLSDKSLAEAFAAWLKANRPPEVKIFETRGSLQLTEALKFLSAWRLLDVMSASEAANMTNEVLGKSLYLDETNWYEAKTKAMALMHELSAPFFSWDK